MTSTVIACGGGRLNGHLMERLADRLSPIPVLSTEALGYNGDWIEAAAFAWLASRTMNGQAGSDRAVTGARESRVLGAIYRKAV